MKLDAPKLVSGPWGMEEVVGEGQDPDIHLHDDEDNTAEVDGGLEGGHGLAVSQSVQGALVYFQQQVSFLGSKILSSWTQFMSAFLIHGRLVLNPQSIFFY